MTTSPQWHTVTLSNCHHGTTSLTWWFGIVVHRGKHTNGSKAKPISQASMLWLCASLQLLSHGNLDTTVTIIVTTELESYHSPTVLVCMHFNVQWLWLLAQLVCSILWCSGTGSLLAWLYWTRQRSKIASNQESLLVGQGKTVNFVTQKTDGWWL